jgi:hypothetical protein
VNETERDCCIAGIIVGVAVVILAVDWIISRAASQPQKGSEA